MFEALFGVPRDLLARGELVLTSDWPPALLVLLLLISALALGLVLARQRGALAPLQLTVIGALQLGMLGLLLMLLWQPGLRTEQLRSGDNVVAVMLDSSASMSFGVADSTRMARAQPLLSEQLTPALSAEHRVQRYLFAEQARLVEDFATLPAPGAQTRIGESLLQVLRQARTTPLAAVILVSDGADNALTGLADRFAEIADFGVPIHAIGMGREEIPEDLELLDVNLPDRALPGTTLAARVAIRHDGAGAARIKVYDGDRILAAQTLPLAAGSNTTTAYVDFPVPEAGHHDLVFTLDRQPGEVNQRNNTRSRALEVPEDRYRLLYLEGEPRWEYKFLRRALEEDPSVELVSVLRVSPNKFYRQGIQDPAELAAGFPADRAELFGYDGLIIGSIEAARFSPEQQAMLRDFVGERGGSLLMLAGLNGLGAGGWGNSALDEVLPARLSADAGDYRRQQVRASLTPLGRASSLLKLSEDAQENERLWQELPAVADYQTIGPLRPAAVSLLDVERGGRRVPLLVTQPYGRGHSYILASGGTWRWQMSMPLENLSHETFWRQLARGLVANSPDQFRLSAEVRGEQVALVAELRDQDYRAMSDVGVTAVVTSGDSEALTVVLQPTDRPGVLAGEFAPGDAGVLFIEALARRGEATVASARLSLRYDAPTEDFGVRQNRALLTALATETGGAYWTAEDLDGLLTAIRHSAAGVTEQDIRPLWSAPVFFLLLLLLKAAEWLVRRRWRTI
jgi:uncharacterized membrane protein